MPLKRKGSQSDAARRTLHVSVLGFQIDQLKEPKAIQLHAALYRLHDDKMIDKESFTSKAIKSTPSAETVLDAWVRVIIIVIIIIRDDVRTSVVLILPYALSPSQDCDFGKVFSLDHPSGNPVLRVFASVKRKSSSGFSSTLTKLGFAE